MFHLTTTTSRLYSSRSATLLSLVLASVPPLSRLCLWNVTFHLPLSLPLLFPPSFTPSSCWLGPSGTTEPCCTHCTAQSLGSDVPCTRSLLPLFLFLPPSSCLSTLHLLQPAAKQTLPVPSIPTGGWKSSLPEIAQIIALQWYFFLVSLAFFFFCASLPLHLFFSHSNHFFSSLFKELVWFQSFFWGERKEKRIPLCIFVLGGRGSQSNHFGLCWFSRNVNRSHRLSQRCGETGELSSFFWPDVAAATASPRRCQRTGGGEGKE